MIHLAAIDGATPEQSREAARSLAAALEARPDRIRRVFEPGGGDFFERNGLLYLDVGELDVDHRRHAGAHA